MNDMKKEEDELSSSFFMWRIPHRRGRFHIECPVRRSAE